MSGPYNNLSTSKIDVGGYASESLSAIHWENVRFPSFLRYNRTKFFAKCEAYFFS